MEVYSDEVGANLHRELVELLMKYHGSGRDIGPIKEFRATFDRDGENIIAHNFGYSSFP